MRSPSQQKRKRFRQLVSDRVAVLMGSGWNSVQVTDRHVSCLLPLGHGVRRMGLTVNNIDVPYRPLFSIEDTAQDTVRRMRENLDLMAAQELARTLG